MQVYLSMLCVFACLFLNTANSKTVDHGAYNGSSKELWSYETVRPGAHMFWWLYYTQAAANYQQYPLIIWLQGGPGASSTGFGNFEELGPLDVKLKPRPTTWLSVANLLFIDNPVGTGYSYVDNDDAYTTNVDEISRDLLTLLQKFFHKLPELQKMPVYIFSESYGGKMTAVFSNTLYQAIQTNDIKCNFQGLALGDSWINGMDYVLTWGPYLYTMSLVDEPQLARINKSAMATKKAFDNGDYTGATALWSATENLIINVTDGINFYNILDWNPPASSRQNSARKPVSSEQKLYYGWKKQRNAIDDLFSRHVLPTLGDEISDLMNGPIRKKLGIIPDHVKWGGQADTVFAKQSGDFMKPVVDSVDKLLASTHLKVVVYTGQLDLICNTLGTETWLQTLTWPGLSHYNQAKRQSIKHDGSVVLYSKNYDRFSFYWILDAGHMVPHDAGMAALKMVKQVLEAA